MTKRFDAPVSGLNKAKSREAVQAYFAVYRKFVVLVQSGSVPQEVLEPVAGYEDAADPDAIHAPGFSFGGGIKNLDGKLRYMAWFIRDVKHTVRLLPDFQRDIMTAQFMGKEQMRNEDAYKALVELKWYVSERHYREQKYLALDLLATAWQLEVFGT
jgi:hypothetical protein